MGRRLASARFQRILEVLAEGRGLTKMELHQKSRLDRGTVNRYLTVLEDQNQVAKLARRYYVDEQALAINRLLEEMHGLFTVGDEAAQLSLEALRTLVKQRLMIG